MDRAEFMLSRPVCLSLPVEEVDKLLREKDGRCAWYIWRCCAPAESRFPPKASA